MPEARWNVTSHIGVAWRGVVRRLIAKREGWWFVVWIGQLGNLPGTVDNRCQISNRNKYIWERVTTHIGVVPHASLDHQRGEEFTCQIRSLGLLWFKEDGTSNKFSFLV